MKRNIFFFFFFSCYWVFGRIHWLHIHFDDDVDDVKCIYFFFFILMFVYSVYLAIYSRNLTHSLDKEFYIFVSPPPINNHCVCLLSIFMHLLSHLMMLQVDCETFYTQYSVFLWIYIRHPSKIVSFWMNIKNSIKNNFYEIQLTPQNLLFFVINI